jgi:hypothetical protein
MYEKRFLWGVEGVREDETGAGGGPLGGVCDLVPSCTLVACDDRATLCSGDRLEGVSCGMEPSNNSARSKVEKVRFASSAEILVSTSASSEFSIRSSVLLFWKWSSPCGVRFFCLEGVAGEPSSCSKLKLACKSWPDLVGMNLSNKRS